jgi:hypothetical protein
MDFRVPAQEEVTAESHYQSTRIREAGGLYPVSLQFHVQFGQQIGKIG